MEYEASLLARSRSVFVSNSQPTLADLRQKIEACESLPSNRRRDLVSALNRTAELFGRTLENIKAHPAVIRELLASRGAAEVGVTQKTYANIRALVGQALRLHGPAIQQLTRRIPLAPAWQALLNRIELHWQRQGLYRLATYCSVMGIAPEDVRSETLRGLFEAVEAEEIVKNTKNILKLTIASWNRSMRTIPNWPQVRLSTPFAQKHWTLPLSVFPKSFQDEVIRWSATMLDPDPTDPDALEEPLRESTVSHRVLQFRQFASALVHSGALRLNKIASLRIILAPAHFDAAVRVFLKRSGSKRTLRIYNFANAMKLIAKHHCRFGPKMLEELEHVCRQIKPRVRQQITLKNRERLRQFDDPENVARLLAVPEREATKAGKEKNPKRAAKRYERAVAVALLIYYGLRLRTLRTLEMSNFHYLAGRPRYLAIRGDQTKTGSLLEFELNDEVSTLVQKFLSVHRPLLPGSNGTFLFPGQKAGPRSKNAMSEAIIRTMKNAGLTMNSHLFRHVLAKIVVERDPGAYLAVSQTLGHSRMNTTLQHYLGTESKAAGKHLDSILNKAKSRK